MNVKQQFHSTKYQGYSCFNVLLKCPKLSNVSSFPYRLTLPSKADLSFSTMVLHFPTFHISFSQAKSQSSLWPKQKPSLHCGWTITNSFVYFILDICSSDNGTFFSYYDHSTWLKKEVLRFMLGKCLYVCLYLWCIPCGCGVLIVHLTLLASFCMCWELHVGSVSVALF